MIHQLRLRLSNVHLFVGSKVVLFDTRSSGDGAEILQWIKSRDLPPPATIILSHGHADHVGSAAELRRATGAKVFLHVGHGGPRVAANVRNRSWI